MAPKNRSDVREEYRPLTERELEILEMLLSVELTGIEQLRAQVPNAKAARWSCGCASFDLLVDREQAPRSSTAGGAVVEATTKERHEIGAAFDLLLWVEDGWLVGVEIVDYVDRHGEESPDEIPSPPKWNDPRPR